MADIGSLDIEITNHCTNGCRFCPYSSMKRPRGFMEFATFIEVVKLARQFNALITLSGMGDPLAHPIFFDFIAVLRREGVRYGVQMNPKSLLQNPGMLQKFKQARVQSMTISFPSTKKEVFEALIPGCDFEAALEVTLSLHALSRSYGGTVRVLGLITSMNKEEERTYLDFWRNLGLRGWVRRCHSRGGHLDNGLNTTAVIKRRIHGCWLFDVHAFIAWNGDYLACCHDLAGESVFGNVSYGGEEKFLEARALVKRQWPPFSACNSCDEEFKAPPRRIRKGFKRLLFSDVHYSTS